MQFIWEAKFPLLKTLEGFDFNAVDGLDIRLIRDLSGCDYIKERRNVIFLGRSGAGKTHLATALGVDACKNNYRTRFVSCYALVNELIEAREERDLQRLIQRYARYDLLILDELDYIPFSKEGSELLFQVLAERQEKGSVIITTNLGFADWTQVFGDPVMTAALLDRLTHRAHIVNCQWDSYRLKQSLQGREPRTEQEK
ncbi:MAG: IS21-like element helper ATPase IstB [Desulfuromonadales bacterium]|nr:IS21-like element helper ATPase IstB [Desulfuromonadales bacterium]